MVRVVRRWIFPAALAAGLSANAGAEPVSVWRPTAPRSAPGAQLEGPSGRPLAPVVQVQAQAQAEAPAPQALGLDDLVRLALERNPRLARAGFAVQGARGRALQAGLYPNPTLQILGDELGDRTGTGGIWTAPFFTQEIVTGNKLRLGRSAAEREVDQATLTLLGERTAVLSAVRRDYVEVLALQNRLALADRLIHVAQQVVAATRARLQAKRASDLDLLQAELELSRLQAEREAIQGELPAALRHLAASVGVPALPAGTLTGSLELPLPDYDLERTRAQVLGVHPELRSAQVGVERARLLLARAQAEPKPNVTVGVGYTRQNQNKSSDWGVHIDVPLPVWNRNQGGIQAAQAVLGEAVHEVARVENDLADRLATAYRAYAAARQRAERYRSTIIPKVREAFDLSMKTYQGGQFDYLRVLAAQKAVVTDTLEYNKALADAWKAAAEIASLAQEETWPPPPPPQK